MGYCYIVLDSSWRSSTFHFVFSDGSAYLDIRCLKKDGSDATTTDMSFDGAGCLSYSLPFPPSLAVKILKMFEEEDKKGLAVEEGTELEGEIRGFFEENYQKVPEIWHKKFIGNGVVRAK